MAIICNQWQSEEVPAQLAGGGGGDGARLLERLTANASGRTPKKVPTPSAPAPARGGTAAASSASAAGGGSGGGCE